MSDVNVVGFASTSAFIVGSVFIVFFLMILIKINFVSVNVELFILNLVFKIFVMCVVIVFFMLCSTTTTRLASSSTNRRNVFV